MRIIAGAFTITRIATVGPELLALAAAARAEEFAFMDRLVSAWADGSNRFTGPGEGYFAAWRDGAMVAAGGLNRDPYCADPAIGRVRHLYVAPSARRGGAGTALMDTIVEHARASFTTLRLRTTTPRGAAFYEALGFARSDAPDASHILRF